MTIDELLVLNPSMSEYTSQKLVLELFNKTEWRCYASTVCAESEALAERFMRYHARLPGFISREIHAHRPVDVFFATDGEASIKGGLYLNGAVLVSHNPGKPRSVSLLIDDAVAQRSNYPDEDYVYLSDLDGDDEL